MYASLFAFADTLTITNTAPAAPGGFSPLHALLIFGAIAALAIGFLVYNQVSAKPVAAPAGTSAGFLPGLFGTASGLVRSPLVHEIEKVVLKAVQSHAQAAINTAAAQFLPGLKPFIPLIEQAAVSAHQKFADAQKSLAEAQSLLAK